MALCTVDYVRSKISTVQTDAILTDIIDETTTEVLSLCGTTDETISSVIQAGKYATLAAVLRYMKTTGELAASVQTPEYKQQNTADTDIEFYQKKADSIIAQYTSVSSYTFASYSDNIGITNYHHGGHHYH